MLYLAFLIIGLLIGYEHRTMIDKYKELKSKVNERSQIGATTGAYGRINEYNVNQQGNTGLVIPKTPQQLEWEESEKLRELQYRK